jgi:uncharacterized protein YjdB
MKDSKESKVFSMTLLVFTICTAVALIGLYFVKKLNDSKVAEKTRPDSSVLKANFPIVVIADAKIKMTDGSPAVGIQAVIIVGKEAETQKKMDIEEAFNIWKKSNPNYEIIRKEKSWDSTDKIYTMYIEYVSN